MTGFDKYRIQDTIRGIRSVNTRVSLLREAGYNVDRKPMGSGGVGQVKYLKNETRYQISYGVGRNNYAYCVIIPS